MNLESRGPTEPSEFAGPDSVSLPVRFHPHRGIDRMQPADRARPGLVGGPLALYAHVPFCVTRCFFCDFVTVVGKHVTPGTVARYQAAILNELKCLSAHELVGRRDLATAQIGGGTPTMLDPHQLADLLAAVCDLVTEAPEAEVLVEGFPTSVAPEKLAVMADVPRLKFNMGVQTFDDSVLAAIGRKHEGEDALRAIEAAKESALQSVGIDLIYGLPTADVRTVLRDLTIAAGHEVDHIALYPLWVYPHTRLNSLVGVGRYREATLAERQDQLQFADALLVEQGFRRYTAFHYARTPGHQHRYGLWQMEGRNWLGTGQGAVSQLGAVVYENDPSYAGYTTRALAGEECTVTARALDLPARMARHLSYGIRLASYQESDFAGLFGREVDDVFGRQLRWMGDEGLVDRAGGAISLTLLGILRLGEIEEAISSAEFPLQRLAGAAP